MLTGDTRGADLETLGLWQRGAHHVLLEIGDPTLPPPPPVGVPATVVCTPPRALDTTIRHA